MNENPSTKPEKPHWTPLQLCLLGALALLAAAYSFRLKADLGFVDEQFYWKLALHLRHLHAYTLDGVSPTAIRPPGYPWMLALVQTIAESVRLAKAANVLLWLVSAGLAASLARRLFGQHAATWALVLVPFYAVELYTAGALYPQALASTLFLLTLWLQLVWRRAGSLAESACQALTWAALLLVVPTFLFNFLIYLAWRVWMRRSTPTLKVVLPVVLPIVVVAAALGGWSARNHAVFHAPVFVSDNSGEMLRYGNSPLTGPNTGPQVPIWTLDPQATALPNELDRENGYKAAAVAWIKANPGRAATLFVEKTLNWFGFRTNLYTAGKSGRLYDAAIAGSYYPLLLGACLLPLLVVPRRRIALLFALQYIVAALGYALFFTRIRYRLPYDYLLIILAAGAFAALMDRRAQMRKRAHDQTELARV